MERIAFQCTLEEYEKIFLVIDGKGTGLAKDFCCSKALKNTKYKVLVLSSEPNVPNSHGAYRQITEQECGMLYQLYHMYEFSNRFQILSRETGYGGMFNFLDTGILDMEEIFEAVLK